MEFEEFAKLFLSIELVDNFDVVRGKVDTESERIDIWLEEKKIVPTEYVSAHEVVAYGFTPESVIQDFPVRGMAVYLHIRRRKWQIICTGKIFSQSFDFTYKGTRLTKELVAFLKDTNRE